MERIIPVEPHQAGLAKKRVGETIFATPNSCRCRYVAVRALALMAMVAATLETQELVQEALAARDPLGHWMVLIRRNKISSLPGPWVEWVRSIKHEEILAGERKRSSLRLRGGSWDNHALSSNTRSPLQVGPNRTMDEAQITAKGERTEWVTGYKTQ
ncbi:hypothetical protein K438DRAFT_1789713 [Mycena galopus ATCC 62051]|nr:hypothetical protein K438DRAFT_1789713 [Mycena galopus ATCC 62051]